MNFIESLREQAQIKKEVEAMNVTCHLCKKEGWMHEMYTIFNDAHGIVYIHEYHRAQGDGMEEPETQDDVQYQESAEEHEEESIEIPHGVPNF